MNTETHATLLIVDDEAEIRKGLAGAIHWQEHGMRLLGTAGDGAEGLRMIRLARPDIVLTDIRMPVMDGLDMVRAAKDEGLQTEFVVLSGHNDFAYAQNAIRYGVREYLLKPISTRELLAALARLREDWVRRQDDETERERLKRVAFDLRVRQLLPDLLQSAIEEKDLEACLREYSLPLSNAQCRAVLLESNADGDNDGTDSITPEIVRERIERYFHQKPCMLSALTEHRVLLVYNPHDESDTLEWIKSLRRLCEAFKRDGVTLTAAIGEEAPSLLRLPLSYRSAARLLPWRIYPSLCPILTAHSVQDAQTAAIDERPDMTALADALLQMDQTKLTDALEGFFRIVFRATPTPPPGYLLGMCSYAVIDVQSRLLPVIETPLDSFTDDAYLTLQNLPSVDEIRAWLGRVFSGYLREIAERRLRKTDPVIERAVTIIRTRILGNIRVEDVCSEVGLSKSYFTAYFKQKTGVNFRDYVLNQKILVAQEHIKKRKCSLEELSDMLGYVEYRSFHRAFKARTGFSPSEYKRRYTEVKSE